MTRWWGRRRQLLAVVVSVLLASVLAACSTTRLADAPDIDAPAAGPTARAGAVTLVAAGDVACGPDIEVTDQECRQETMADLVESLSPDAVLVLGDTAYEQVTADAPKSYDVHGGVDELSCLVADVEQASDLGEGQANAASARRRRVGAGGAGGGGSVAGGVSAFGGVACGGSPFFARWR